MRTILAAVIVHTDSGLSREDVEAAVLAAMVPLFAENDGAVYVLEKDMDPDEKEEGVGQIEKFFELAI